MDEIAPNQLRRTDTVIMFMQAFVLERPSTSRPPKLNFGSATASCVTWDHSQNTSPRTYADYIS
jgi:hypothetical protein